MWGGVSVWGGVRGRGRGRIQCEVLVLKWQKYETEGIKFAGRDIFRGLCINYTTPLLCLSV